MPDCDCPPARTYAGHIFHLDTCPAMPAARDEALAAPTGDVPDIPDHLMVRAEIERSGEEF